MSEWTEPNDGTQPASTYSDQELKILDLMVRIWEINPSPQELEQAMQKFKRLVHRTQIGREEMN